MMKRIAVAAILFAPISLPAAAFSAGVSYSSCVGLVQKDPSLAEETARDWQKNGGGSAAMHCSALALTALKRYADAARELDALGRSHDVVNLGDRAALYDQAGNAWLLANEPTNAINSFSAALREVPNNIDALIDRARTRGMQKDWAGAESDLSTALVADQNRADLLVLRASARRALGHKADAATDILRALSLFPNYPAALVERGAMKYEAGDTEGARKDWTKAATGQGEAAERARRYLAQMELPRGK